MVYPSFARELENELAHLRAEVERLKGMASWAHTCIHHNDAERAGAACPCCAITRAEKAETELAAAIQISAKYENRYFKTLAELASMSIIAEKWEADALRYARNAEYWQARAEKAEAEAKQLINAGVNN
jgi:hypothetical protein